MYKFKFADIGEGIHEATITEINVKLGQPIQEGEVVISVETDKVTTEITSPKSGFINKVNFKSGEIIKVGDTIIEIVEQLRDLSFDAPVSENFASPSVVGSLETSNDLIPNYESQTPASLVREPLINPATRKLAQEHHINLANVQGSGPNGRILLQDIQALITNQPQLNPQNSQLANASPAINQVTSEKMTTLQKTIASAMIEAKSNIPEAVMFTKINATPLVAAKNHLKAQTVFDGLKLTYLPFIIKALTLALQKHPKLNCSYNHTLGTVEYKHFYNIGIAVDGPKGLIVPVIKDVNKKSLATIAQELTTLIAKVKDNSLQIGELKGGTFTVTNYGSVGIEYGTPIIKTPESAIMGIGVITKQPIVDQNNQIIVQDVLPISLTIDHRIIDGGTAGRFVQTFSQLIEKPQDWM